MRPQHVPLMFMLSFVVSREHLEMTASATDFARGEKNLAPAGLAATEPNPAEDPRVAKTPAKCGAKVMTMF